MQVCDLAQGGKLLASGGGLPNADRQKVYEELLPLAKKDGDATAGKVVFEKQCMKCHTHSGKGTKIGPDLTGMAVHPKAELLIHQTWAYRVDDPRFSPKAAAGEPKTQEEMYTMLTAAYKTIAKELGVRRIPVGDAFHIADTDPAWAYKPDTKFDRSTAVAPALPDQTHSLHAGWRWDAKTGKLGMDGHHANTAGEYLGACVWYEVLFKESAVGNSFAPDALKPEDVKYLQDVAHRAVEAAK